MAGTDDDEGKREPIARNVGADPEVDDTDRCSTAGGAGDAETRDGIGVCPMVTSGGGGVAGGMDDRGKRTVDTLGEGEGTTDDGIGVGRRKPGKGVGLRITDDGCDVMRFSTLGGAVDLRDEEAGATEGGCGVMRFSGGGIVDLRDEEGVTDGGGGVDRFSACIGNLREDAGSTDERAGTASSSTASNVSPLRGSTAGVCVEERRDEPRDELCG